MSYQDLCSDAMGCTRCQLCKTRTNVVFGTGCTDRPVVMVIGEGHDSFSEGLVTLLKEFPPFDLLQGYAATLVGTHDFTTFASARDICPSKVRDIYESSFSWTTSIYGERVLCYRICGNAFLYHMVRSLVGSMLEYAKRGASVSEFVGALEAKDRLLAGKTAPSDGLYLWRVSYDPSEYQWFEDEYGKN